MLQAFAVFAIVWSLPVRAEPPPPMPSHALILFGARWCAPCSAELHDLGAILLQLNRLTGDANSPPPAQLVLAWIDRPVASSVVTRAVDTMTPTRMAPPRVLLPLPFTASAWAEPRMTTAHGLPFAVMTDAAGRVCALHKGALQPVMITALWDQCRGWQKP